MDVRDVTAEEIALMSLEPVLPTCLYVHWEHDRCLYVGRSINPGRRCGVHRREAGWWHEVTHITLERVPADEISEVEVQRSKALHPVHNIHHNWTHDEPQYNPALDVDAVACAALGIDIGFDVPQS